MQSSGLKKLKGLKSFYSDHLFNSILPFWLKNGLDLVNGGFYTCFNNYGTKLISKNKYVWSQGRFLWVLSHLLGYNLDKNTRALVTRAAREGAKFLRKHAILPDMRTCWLLDEKGNPIMPTNTGTTDGKNQYRNHFHIGIESDYFLLYGFAEYSMAFNDRSYFDLAYKIFSGIQERITSGNFQSAPHGVPVGFKSHSIYMLNLESLRELILAARHFNDPLEKRLLLSVDRAIQESLDGFLQNDRYLLEMIKSNGKPSPDELLGGYINPGHSLEHAWFIFRMIENLKGFLNNNTQEIIDTAISICRNMFDIGWDTEWGGLFQYLHWTGSPPKGVIRENNSNDPLIEKLLRHWDKKLWWVHSEALYALIYAYILSGDDIFHEKYMKLHNYTFKTFPNTKTNNGDFTGEWIQIRNRKGEPVEEVVALPVKDPFHIARAFMFIIETLDKHGC